MLGVASMSVSSGVSNNWKHDTVYSFQGSASVRCHLDQVGLWAFVLIALNEVERPSLMGGPIPYIWVFRCVNRADCVQACKRSLFLSSLLMPQVPAASACLP